MSLTANITRLAGGGTEPFVAGVTHHVFSAMTSFGTSAGDFWRQICRCEWTFPDGQTKAGGVVHWFPNAAINGNVVLTVFDGSGSGSDGKGNRITSTYAVTFTTFSYTFDKWVSQSGNDGTGDGSQAKPWLTYQAAWTPWRAGPTVGRVRTPAGETCSWVSSFPSGPNFGPMLITGSGGQATASMLDNAQPLLSASGSDVGSELSHPVNMDGVSVTYPQPQDAGGAHTGFFEADHLLSAFVRGTIHNATMQLKGSGAVMWQATVEFSADLGIGISSSNFVVLDAVVSHGNGTDNTFDHQIYDAGGSDHGMLDCFADGRNATGAYSGIKLDGTQRSYVTRCTSYQTNQGVDSSGNPDTTGSGGNQNLDMIIDGHICDGVVQGAFFANYCNRFSLRNARVYFGCANQFMKERSYNNTDTSGHGNQVAQNVDILNCSIDRITGIFVNFTTSLWTAWTVQNNAVVISGDNYFYVVQNSADLVNLTVDHNVYWRTNSTIGQNNFALVGGVAKTFAQWVALTGKEVGSVFADPLFTGDRDLTFKPLSPCRNAGLVVQATGVDALGLGRGLVRDIGAIDMNYPATIVSAVQQTYPGDQLAGYCPAMKEVYGERGSDIFG